MTEVDDAAGTRPLAAVVDALAASPLHALSLGSHELFFSNLLAWGTERFPTEMAQALTPWLSPGDGETDLRVRREWRNLDLVVEYPGFRPLVIENKSLSMPDETQLRRYDEKIASAIAEGTLATPTKVLLAPVDPGWTSAEHDTWTGNGPWSWLSFGMLGERLRAASWGSHRSYAELTMHELADLMALVQELLNSRAARPLPSDPLELGAEEYELLQTVRVHHLVKKARARHVGALVRRRLQEVGLSTDVAVWTDMTNGLTLVDGLPLRENQTLAEAQRTDRLQWQMQGGQLRLAAVFPQSLPGRSADAIQARIAAAEKSIAWFDFSDARAALGHRCGPETGKWLRFNPDFVYRNVRIKDPLVSDVVTLGEHYSRRLVEFNPPPAAD